MQKFSMQKASIMFSALTWIARVLRHLTLQSSVGATFCSLSTGRTDAALQLKTAFWRDVATIIRITSAKSCTQAGKFASSFCLFMV